MRRESPTGVCAHGASTHEHDAGDVDHALLATDVHLRRRDELDEPHARAEHVEGLHVDLLDEELRVRVDIDQPVLEDLRLEHLRQIDARLRRDGDGDRVARKPEHLYCGVRHRARAAGQCARTLPTAGGPDPRRPTGHG